MSRFLWSNGCLGRGVEQYESFEGLIFTEGGGQGFDLRYLERESVQ